MDPSEIRTATRRACLRRAVRLCCLVRSDFWDGVAPHLLTELSEEGAWLATDLPLEAGEHVSLIFRPPQWPVGQQPLRARGEIVRVELSRRRDDPRAAGMGVRFTDLQPQLRANLASALLGLPPPLPVTSSSVEAI